MGDILFLAHRMPFPPNRGDKIRSHHLLKGLAQIAPVHVGTFAETDEDRAEEHSLAEIAESYCLRDRTKHLALAGAQAILTGKPVSLAAFEDSRLRAWVAETIAAREIDTIFVFSGQMGQYVPDDFVGRIIIDLCDVDSAKFADYAGTAPWPKSALFRREDRLLSCEESRLQSRANHTLLISFEEVELLHARIGRDEKLTATALGNGIDTAFFDPARVSANHGVAEQPGPHLIFTGQMDYPPNESAALWTIDQFMPTFRRRHPNAQFHVVGRNPTARLSQRDGENGARIWGEVADVRPFLAASDLAFIPLNIARGVQNKVLEAMAMELCVLLTPEAATGIAGEDGREFVIANPEFEQMIDRADELIGDPARRTEIGKAARTFVKSQMSWDAVYEQLADLVAGSAPEAGSRNAA